jgi:predicted glycosyltransferase
MKVLIVVTHLLGTGHLSRALTLGRAFAAAGHQVQVASGGFPALQLDTDGVGLVQLPPLRSDGVDFTRLLTPEGTVADESYLGSRIQALTGVLNTLAPDILITELYPFGRRSLAGEFDSLLQAAHTLPDRPVVLGSVRDILAPPSKPKKVTRADDIISKYYDAVLVHSDPQATRLEVSWPVSDKLAGKLRYTGYVTAPPPAAHPDGDGQDEVLVTAGGGDVGDHLFETALAAAQRDPSRQWRLLIGGGNAKDRADRFNATGSPAIVEPVRPDFRQMLNHAAALVGMCGYNTAMDVLQTGIPAVLVPFDAGKEVEQTLRAQSLGSLDGISVLPDAGMTPDRLLAALDQVTRAPARPSDLMQFDGAAQSVEIAVELAGARR